MNRSRSSYKHKHQDYSTQTSVRIERKTQKLFSCLQSLFFKKKRYTLQVIKQFYLFPQGSSAQVTIIQDYDRLIFDDDKIHTMVKKLQTKVLELKIWGFLSIKMFRVLKQVNLMVIKINDVVQDKTQEYKYQGFTRIQERAVNDHGRDFSKISRPTRTTTTTTTATAATQRNASSPSYNPLYESPSSTSLRNQSIIKQSSSQQQQLGTTSNQVVNQVEQVTFRHQRPCSFTIHRGSHSRTPSVVSASGDSNYNSSGINPNFNQKNNTSQSPYFMSSSGITTTPAHIRTINQEKIKIYPRQHQGLTREYDPFPQRKVIQVSSKSFIGHQAEIQHIRRQYRNCYRIAPTVIRVVSCGCQKLAEGICCECTTSLNRLCGCSACCNSCDGCAGCNSCHSHCNCKQQRSRSYSRQRHISQKNKSLSSSRISYQGSDNRSVSSGSAKFQRSLIKTERDRERIQRTAGARDGIEYGVITQRKMNQKNAFRKGFGGGGYGFSFQDANASLRQKNPSSSISLKYVKESKSPMLVRTGSYQHDQYQSQHQRQHQLYEKYQYTPQYRQPKPQFSSLKSSQISQTSINNYYNNHRSGQRIKSPLENPQSQSSKGYKTMTDKKTGNIYSSLNKDSFINQAAATTTPTIASSSCDHIQYQYVHSTKKVIKSGCQLSK